jgi:hypothetical protein
MGALALILIALATPSFSVVAAFIVFAVRFAE